MVQPTISNVQIVEVGLRDGIQGIGTFIPTRRKIELLHRLYTAGVRRMEVTSFVSPKAIPQLADAPELLAAAKELRGLICQVLVPSERYGYSALEAGADFVAFVVSASEAHNLANVRRTRTDSANEYGRLVRALRGEQAMRLNVATAFDCPFEGRISSQSIIDLLDVLVPMNRDAEICLCDTTGKATPNQVKHLFAAVRERYPDTIKWAVHTHDTYGLGLANCVAAIESGVRVLDAALAGLGGCPFAPGATGNTATEDLIWLCDRSDIITGIDLEVLVDVARLGAQLPDGNAGGRVRAALSRRDANCIPGENHPERSF